MITPKERAKLKALSHNQRPLLQIGKSGLNEGLFTQLDKLLEDHELVKISILQNSSEEMEEIIPILLERMNADFVQSIGSKLTLYRKSKEDPKIEL